MSYTSGNRVRLSVIIPLYNAEQTIEKSLESVRIQNLDQTVEVLVIDDGSTDGGAIRVKNFMKKHPDMKIHLIHQENFGVSKARNVGLKLAEGDFIAFLDADDEWLPQKTERQMAIFESLPHVEFLASEINYHKMKCPYRPNTQRLAEITLKKLLIRNETSPSTVILRREIVDKGFYFDDNQRYAEDVNYWLKLSLNFKMYILAETLVIAGGGKRTFGVSGLSANLREMAKGFQKNLVQLYHMKVISFWQFLFYTIFYRMKYQFLVFRTLINK